MSRSPDWPDWSGQAVAIVASGPSAKKAGAETLEGRMTVAAIKRSWELAPFAAAVYGCDLPWWRDVRGLPNFTGRKWAHNVQACDRYGLQRVKVISPENKMLFDETGVVGSGGNSGFHMLNLAVQLGATRVLLIGFDVHDRSGIHWYGRNIAYQQSNPTEINFRRWRAAFDLAAGQLERRGVEVLNASPISDIKGFARASVPEALERWGL